MVLNDFLTILQKLEERVAALEQKVFENIPRQSYQPVSTPPESRQQPEPPRPLPSLPQQFASEPSKPIGGKVLGAAAVICFVLAAAYFVALAIDEGWLTPTRQVMGAASFGFILIISSILLHGRDRAYVGLLAAAGLVVEYLTVLTAHLGYRLISDDEAGILLMMISGGAFLLFRIFAQDLFLVAAVVGSYASPFLVDWVSRGVTLRISFYYLIWDIIFIFLAGLLARRALINLAAYMALGSAFLFLTADTVGSGDDKVGILIFQFLQFALFSAGTAWFSKRNNSPLTRADSWALLPLALVFYGFQYVLLKDLTPEWAPWVAIGFAALLIIGQKAAEAWHTHSLPYSFELVVNFAACILFHAAYLNLLNPMQSAWLGLILLIVAVPLIKAGFTPERFPIANGLIWLVSIIEYMHVARGFSFSTYGWVVILLQYLFGAVLLAGAFKVRDWDHEITDFLRWTTLSLSGIQLWRAVAGTLEQTIPQWSIPYSLSASMGLYALVLMATAWGSRDMTLARFSFGVFFAVALKVIFSDLSNASPIARIVTLVVVGTLLFVGGMILRAIVPRDNKPHSAPTS